MLWAEIGAAYSNCPGPIPIGCDSEISIPLRCAPKRWLS